MWHVKDFENLQAAQQRESVSLQAAATATPRPAEPAVPRPAQDAGGPPRTPQPGRPAPQCAEAMWCALLVVATMAGAQTTAPNPETLRLTGPRSGAQVYSRTCAACHQADGAGAPGTYPPLGPSEFVTGSADRLLHIVLRGLTGEIEVEGEPFKGQMPGWAPALDDAQVAAVLTYIRASFGNEAPAITAAHVAAVRKASAQRNTPYTMAELAQVSAVPRSSGVRYERRALQRSTAGQSRRSHSSRVRQITAFSTFLGWQGRHSATSSTWKKIRAERRCCLHGDRCATPGHLSEFDERLPMYAHRVACVHVSDVLHVLASRLPHR